ncbi:MAG: S41 family peptidase [Lachnospiraceae bacterium]
MVYGDWLYIGLEIVSGILLFLLGDYAVKKLNPRWKLCYLIPVLISMIFIAILQWETSLLGVYIGSLVVMAGFFWEKANTRKICSLVLLAATIGSCIFANIYGGYRAPDYVKDFKKGFHNMKAHYVLSDYKNINWDQLYDTYLPRFKEANRKHDKIENAIVWQDFCNEFYDGHVGFMESEETQKAALRRIAGNDYGMSLMTLSNGKTVAVNVADNMEAFISSCESDNPNNLIKNGTEVIAWNQMTIDEAKNSISHQFMAFPDKENEAFYSALLVAGIGNEQVTITVLKENGEPVDVTLTSHGDYYDRLMDTLAVLNQGVEGDNLSFSEPSNNTVCLRISQMMYDSKSYENGDHSQMEEELRAKLNQYKEKGIKHLIIDLRSNGGGSPQFIMTIGKLLAPKGQHTYCREAVWDDVKKEYPISSDTGNYIPGEALTYEGEGLWEDGDILLLINAECVSAGDHFIMMMSEFDNVKTMGFTKSMSSAQAVNSVSLDSGILMYSGVPVLDENSNIFVDTNENRISSIPLDEKISFDETAVNALFDRNQDFILNKAIEYCEQIVKGV